ncbi:hypothetical protein M3180_16045 [Paenibacillus camelliae]|nr:hypothetical protein [Paenibacillus camelliae]
MVISWTEKFNGQIQSFAEYDMNRRVPNGMHGGVRGRGLAAPSYSIYVEFVNEEVT